MAGEVLQMQEITATAEDYLSAVAAVEAQVPHGWRVLYVRADDAPAPDLPASGTDAQSSTGATAEEGGSDDSAAADAAAGDPRA